jgi:hypothetical protein
MDTADGHRHGIDGLEAVAFAFGADQAQQPFEQPAEPVDLVDGELALALPVSAERLFSRASMRRSGRVEMDHPVEEVPRVPFRRPG